MEAGEDEETSRLCEDTENLKKMVFEFHIQKNGQSVFLIFDGLEVLLLIKIFPVHSQYFCFELHPA